MAKSLIFQFNGNEIMLSMKKIDRSKLYGYKEVEVIDENEHKCELATLAEDGRTVVGKGGTAMAYLSVDGNWCDRTEIKPVNLEGDEITPVPSSFSSTIELSEKTSLSDYLDHNIRLIYQMDLDFETEEDGAAENLAYGKLVQDLANGAIYAFPYSYRGGLEADTGFLLTNEKRELFFVVGDRTDISMVGLQQTAAANTEEVVDDDASGDLMDFDMI